MPTSIRVIDGSELVLEVAAQHDPRVAERVGERVIVALLLVRGSSSAAGDMTTGDVRNTSSSPGRGSTALDGDVGLVQLVEQFTERVHGAIGRDLQDQLSWSGAAAGVARPPSAAGLDLRSGVGRARRDPALQLIRVPSATIRPCRARDPVGQLVRLVQILVVSSMVTPAKASSRTISHMVRRLRGSKRWWFVQENHTGSPTRVIARSSRRRIPPSRSTTVCSRRR